MDASPEIPLIPDAVRAVSDLVDRVPEGSWAAPSPCDGWTVRDVLNHLTSEHLWAPHLLRGETLEQVGDRYDGDVLGEQPGARWRRAVAGSTMAFGQVPDAGTPVHVSAGRISAREYAQQMLVDLTVHGWDLSRGAGVSFAAVPDAVEAGWAYQKPRVGARDTDGIFAPPVPTDSEDRLDQLVALLGRDPRWRAA
jgi:uncharacterized protein (TIGR03086 family)